MRLYVYVYEYERYVLKCSPHFCSYTADVKVTLSLNMDWFWIFPNTWEPWNHPAAFLIDLISTPRLYATEVAACHVLRAVNTSVLTPLFDKTVFTHLLIVWVVTDLCGLLIATNKLSSSFFWPLVTCRWNCTAWAIHDSGLVKNQLKLAGVGNCLVSMSWLCLESLFSSRMEKTLYCVP